MPVMPALTAIRHKPKEVKQHKQYQGHGLAASVRRMTRPRDPKATLKHVRHPSVLRPPPCAGTARVGLEELLGSTSPSRVCKGSFRPLHLTIATAIVMCMQMKRSSTNSHPVRASTIATEEAVAKARGSLTRGPANRCDCKISDV